MALGIAPPPANAPIGLASAATVTTTTSSSAAAMSSGMDNIPGLGNQLLNPLGLGMGGLVGEGGALTKPHRELYVGNIPPGTTVPQLADFLNAIMKQLGLTTSPSGCIITAWVSTDGHYAFAEFRTIEETLAALQYLNGLQVGAHVLKVGRPKGYNGGSSALAVPMGMVPQIGGMSGLGTAGGINTALSSGGGLGALGALTLGTSNLSSLMGMGGLGTGLSGGLMGGLTSSSTTTSTSSNVIMVTNLPLGINEEQIQELVSTFGEVKAFNLIKTADTSQSAVLEYIDKKVTEDAIAGKNLIIIMI